ncbi:hypothetical protein DFJ58DRAFT_471095 [Suillus subalutaceus]|uniref:uncharacterized protein n=1 Tax=Suillus subalutaceus TaxID=48586 RepID=UPI001B867FBA|nr:uncharacterized protein DFJ58DRAFT_471088 [Suillus subalutaceus]XP_041249398.1 uncharacterized protein DFJ58DRAFT_471095 [Suillus subalutaceus]KAG1871855.1 hypothetical protein DFJ58DRAFT_471088 [Suillus subalutaceus]KAG1871859.1 hypothetical protein DFJ58DRAFT_471095 [Suillus subalutaceus]
MPFSTDGVYTIRNIGRALMLDLKGDSTAEGNQIQGYADNGTEAQKWVIKKQEEPRNSENTFTIQTSNTGNNGNGFFAAAKQDADEPVVYTRQAFLVDLVPGVNDIYSIKFTLGSKNLVLSIPSDEDSAVRLANFNAADAYQQWALIRVGDLQSVGN